MLQLSDLKIAVIGLGYVGLPLAVEFGKKVPVIGFDIHPTSLYPSYKLLLLSSKC